jgi:hypothetical protein
MYTYIIVTQRNKIPYILHFLYLTLIKNALCNFSNISHNHILSPLFRHQPVIILISTSELFFTRRNETLLPLYLCFSSPCMKDSFPLFLGQNLLSGAQDGPSTGANIVFVN